MPERATPASRTGTTPRGRPRGRHVRRVRGRRVGARLTDRLQGRAGVRHQSPGAHRDAPEGAGARHAHVALDFRYTLAMGQGCPDTAACDKRYYGFFNQVYGAAWQLKRYANPAGTSQYFTWYAPGNTWNVRYHPTVVVRHVAGLHPEPGDRRPVLLHAVSAERGGAARRLRRGRRLLGLRQPQLLQLLHATGSDRPRARRSRHSTTASYVMALDAAGSSGGTRSARAGRGATR